MVPLPSRMQQSRHAALGLQLRPAEAGKRIVVLLPVVLGKFPGKVGLPGGEHCGLHLAGTRLGVPRGEYFQHGLLPLLGRLGQLVIGQQVHLL